jgi:hypothetical protein
MPPQKVKSEYLGQIQYFSLILGADEARNISIWFTSLAQVCRREGGAALT